MNEKTAATVRIRNFIVAVHEGEEKVTVSVWPDEECDDALESVSVRYDSVFKAPCGSLCRVTDSPCCGDPDQDCEICRLLDADVSKRVSPYKLVLPCGKLEVMTKNCCGDKKKWDLCEDCKARIRVSLQEREIVVPCRNGEA